MRKYLLGIFFLLSAFTVCSQTYNNEWINYSNTYYKFKVGSNGLYRISQPSLAAIGLSTTPAQHFQLWRNGQEVAIFTSKTTGVFSATDFIEFYGQVNDGKADKPLYKYDSLQMSDKLSLFTDTAAYFLTVNTGSNKRFINTSNDVAGNVLPPETGFMHTIQKLYRNKENSGYSVDYGQLLYSSSFETAEGWSSNDLYTGSLIDNNSNIYLDNTGAPATLDLVAAGNANAIRSIKVKVNGTILADSATNGFSIKRFHIANIPLSLLSSGNANVEVVNGGVGIDRIVVSHYELKYPHLYNFEGRSQFSFELPVGAGRYLEINNFNFGSTAPILLDLTNNTRLIGNMNGATVRFVIPALSAASSFILLNSQPANINNVQDITQRVFINYALPANQGDYVIISHPLLFDDGSGNNNVDKYRVYRNSVAGGSFNSMVADINQLTDQFAFGIKHHPAAIRNFGYYALANFTTIPKYFYLIGKGLAYPDFRKYESDPNINKLALVPTFGYPASDNLLLATRTGSFSQVSIGRLSAINGSEVGAYLDKVKQFELVQNTGPQTNANKGWMKNVAQITGAIDDASLSNLINFFMDGYTQTMGDTSFGGKVYSFNKNSGLYTAIGSNKTIDDLFTEGMSYITYFGHSSPNTLEFNLDNPQGYNNTGKYPLIMVNGCNTGNLFLFDTLRPINKGTLSEKYIFANNKGSIGFIADTHFGLPQQLNFFTEKFDKNLASDMYGQSIGNIMQGTMEYLSSAFINDYPTRMHIEEITYHGDPAVKLNPFTQPDYTIEDSLVKTSPSVVSVADEKVIITAKVLNIGKAINDSFNILVQHQLPDNSIEVLATRRIKATLYEDTIQVPLMIDPLKHVGSNKIIVTIDQDNEISELSESNNTITKSFTIIENEIRPVFPYEYSIVNSGAGLALYGSTANPLSAEKQYVMEMDTSRLFNSTIKVSQNITDSGGIIKFLPALSLIDSTVYYWRLAVGPANGSTRWLGSSFMYINGSIDDGYAQAHYYQYKDDSFASMNIDSTTRKFGFDNKVRKLLIRTGLYPYYNWDQINVNVDNDQLDLYGCTYNALQFVVYNPLTLLPWRNHTVGSTGRFGSSTVCANGSDPTRIFFEYDYTNATKRANAMNFFDSIPAGYIVSVTNLGINSNTVFIDTWKADTTVLGSGKSLWHKFHQAGLHQIDSFTNNRPFLFVFRKGDTINFPVRQHIGEAVNAHIVDTFLISGKTVSGTVSSPWLGPVKNWKDFKWDTLINSPATTNQHYFDIIGKDVNENEMYLGSVYNAKDTSLSYISAAVYPKLQLVMHNTDEQNAMPEQLKYWMVTSDNYPEGAVSPNLVFHCADTLTTSDTLHLKVAFKNISNVAFDSIKVKLTITGADGVPVEFTNLANGAKIKPLIAGDTAIISYDINLASFNAGITQLKLEVNPGEDQPEQFHFNNILYKNIYIINPVCPGSNVSFTVASSIGNMQWQVNTGTGFTNISNGSLYSGVNTSTLVINNGPTNMYGYRYRCVFTGNNETTSSQEFVLKYTAIWAGTVNTAWELAANWACGTVPDANTDVIVKAGAPNYPVINSNASCRSIAASGAATIRLKSSFNLLITGK